MAIRIMSDLHMEFSNLELPPLETDKDDILILAGDIGVANSPHTFAAVKTWAPRFRQVIQICGNHEYYHSSLLHAKEKIRKYMVGCDNWTLADNSVVRIDDVSFVCGTLWTDFKKGDPLVMQSVRRGLNDYNQIRTGPNHENAYVQRISPFDISNEHLITKNFIFKSIVEEKYIDDQKIVVVTHHAPSEKSIDFARYGNDILNWAYVSNLSNEILDTVPNLWIHGHTHTSFDYMIGDTRIIANPRGYCYPQSTPENSRFNPTLRIEI